MYKSGDLNEEEYKKAKNKILDWMKKLSPYVLSAADF